MRICVKDATPLDEDWEGKEGKTSLSPDQSNMAVEAMGVRAQTENIPVSRASKSQSLHLQIKGNVHTLFICFITGASVAFL